MLNNYIQTFITNYDETFGWNTRKQLPKKSFYFLEEKNNLKYLIFEVFDSSQIDYSYIEPLSDNSIDMCLSFFSKVYERNSDMCEIYNDDPILDLQDFVDKYSKSHVFKIEQNGINNDIRLDFYFLASDVLSGSNSDFARFLNFATCLENSNPSYITKFRILDDTEYIVISIVSEDVFSIKDELQSIILFNGISSIKIAY